MFLTKYRAVKKVPAAIEVLEGRRLLASDFGLRIHFAPEAAPEARGYKLDYGSQYSRHGNGLTYGWSYDKESDTRYTQTEYDNPRADAHINVSSGDSWSIKVPDGWYSVKGLAGDIAATDGDYRYDAENQPLIKGKPYPGFPFIEGRTVVEVTDGKLTITPARKAVDNLLCTLSISAVDAPVATAQGVNIRWTQDNSVSSPVARVESAVVRIGDDLVVLGGFTQSYDQTTRRVDVLNTKTGEWTRWADLPGPTTHIAAASDGRYIYTAGGQSGPLLSNDLTSLVYRYDIKKNTWQRFGRLPEVRAGAQMQLLGHTLHLVGGDDSTRVLSQSTHYTLDLDNPDAGWSEAAPLPVATDHHTSIVVNGDLYVLGGETDHGTSYFTQGDFFRYNAGQDKWVTLPTMPMGISHQEGATLTDGHRIIVIAGQTDVQQMTGNVYSYDIDRGVWDQHPSLPTARKGGVAYLVGDTIHYFAGDDEKYGQPLWSYEGVIG